LLLATVPTAKPGADISPLWITPMPGTLKKSESHDFTRLSDFIGLAGLRNWWRFFFKPALKTLQLLEGSNQRYYWL
jgi:hypothetical protein